MQTKSVGLVVLFTLLAAWRTGAEPLPSWNDGASKTSLLAFVEAVTKEGSTEFVPPAERIAVFDNDGTLWAEQPANVRMNSIEVLSDDQIRVELPIGVTAFYRRTQ